MPDAQPASALDTSVLVLNRYYMAVHVVSARRAFILLYRETAEVIHLEDGQYLNFNFTAWCEASGLWSVQKGRHEDWIQAVGFELQVPRVIRLVHFDRIPRQTLRFNRRNLLARDGHRCQYCGRRAPLQQLSLDHVLPRSRGGQTSWENVVCSCVDCNAKKGGRTPREARMALIQQPARPKFNPLLSLKLRNPKYESWKSFLPEGVGTMLDAC